MADLDRDIQTIPIAGETSVNKSLEIKSSIYLFLET
jgi:hypothetical protein